MVLKTYFVVVFAFFEKFFKTKEITYELTPQRAETRAKKSADETIEKNLKNSEIISKKQKTSLDSDKLIVTTEIKCLKDVVFEEKLLLDTSNWGKNMLYCKS